MTLLSSLPGKLIYQSIKLTADTVMSLFRPSIIGSNTGLKAAELNSNVCLFFWHFPDSLHRSIKKRQLLLHVSTLARDV
jgi:hypothetical protein